MLRKKASVSKVLLILISLFWIMSTEAIAKDGAFKFTNFTSEDGLSQVSGCDILQDNDGYIWIATYDGLNRYDGYNFKVYKNIPFDDTSLSDNGISSLWKDQHGILWIGTRQGLNKYNPDTEEFTKYYHDENDPNSLSDNIVSFVISDRHGDIWIATGDGLDKLDVSTQTFTHYKHDPNDKNSITNNVIYRLYEDRQGMIWVGTNKGLNRFNPKDGTFKRYLNDPNDKKSLSHNVIYRIYEDTKGDLWVGTRSGLNVLDRKNDTFTRFLHNPKNPESIGANKVQEIFEDSKGRLWLGTDGGGLSRFDRETKTFENYKYQANNPYSLIDNDVMTIYEDASGMIWVGTYNGLSMFNPDPDFIHYSSSGATVNTLNDKKVYAIYKDKKEDLWVGTYNGGLNRLNLKTGEGTYYQHDPNDATSISHNRVWEIKEDSKGNLLIGTDYGFNIFERETETFKRYYKEPDNPNSLSDNRVKSIYEDEKGILWIGTRAGLDAFDRRTGHFLHYFNSNPIKGMKGKHIKTIYGDGSNNLWLGTTLDGLIKFNKETETYKAYTHNPEDKNTISHNSIKDIHGDAKGNLWIGTNNGLNKFDTKEETFALYTEEDGLANNYVYGILEDASGYLWMSTNDGLSEFNPETEKFNSFGVEDGLQSNEFNSNAFFNQPKGQAFFGGVNGLNSFTPSKLIRDTHIPSVIISDVKVFDQSIKVDKEIHLSHKENFFSFDFVTLDFKNPSKNQYAYMLEGLDKDWIYSGSRHYASYTNLDGGEYVFKVKGANSNGIWNEKGTSIKIIIDKPPWKRWWAYLIYGLVIGLILYLVFNYVNVLESLVKQRTYELHQSNVSLKENMDEKKKLYQKIIDEEKFKNNFFVNLSHELRTPLNLILSTVQLAEIQGKNNNSYQWPKLKKHVDIIKQNSYRLLKVVNNLIDVTKISSGEYRLSLQRVDIISLVEDLVLSMGDYINNQDIELIVDTDVEEKVVQCDPVEVERIVLNIMSNAIKFTAEKGHIWVNIYDEVDHVKICIKDDGIGMPNDIQATIFERFKQANNNYSRGNQGSGIGLNLVKSLIDLHGGSIKLTSEEGHGSEFVILLPVNNPFANGDEGELPMRGKYDMEVTNMAIELSELTKEENQV